MTPEEAKGMEGTEFTYIFEDGDTVPAFVKKFEVSTGKLTCFSLEAVSRDGYIPSKTKDTQVDGTFCVIGTEDLEESLRRLEEIKAEGSYKNISWSFMGANFRGCSI